MDEPASAIVVVGASAGGVEALQTLAAGLPPDLDAAVAVVLHLPTDAESRLAGILDRAGALPAETAADGEPLHAGRIHVAPPGRHLLVRDGRCVLARGARENGARPAVDVLFRSAALEYGPRTVAVVLTGNRDDGAAGAAAIASRGGTVLVQDPADALFAGMPTEALRADHPDRVLPLRELPAAIVAAVRAAPEPRTSDDGRGMAAETAYATLDPETIRRTGPPGAPSLFSCPECGGVLWEAGEDDVLRFRCRTGHAYTAASALAEQSDVFEGALWTALRVLEERAELLDRMAERAGARNAPASRSRYEDLVEDAREQAETIRRVLVTRIEPSV